MRLIVTLVFLCAATVASADTTGTRIGAVFSLSGWGAAGGTPELNGALLAQEELLSRRDTGCPDFTLVTEDNRSDLRATADAFRKVVSVNGAPVVIGPNWSEFIDVVAPLAVSSRVPVITATGYKAEQVKPDPWVFVLWPPPTMATKTLADYIAAQKLQRIHVLINENAYMRGVLDALRPQLESRGVSILEVSSFNPGEMNYRSIITKILHSNADGVIALLLESGEFAAFLRQRREQKLALPLFAANTLPFDPVVKADLGLADGLVYFDYNTPGGAEFAARYRRRFNSDPGFGSAKAYDALKLAVAALQAVGPSPEKIREYLRAVKFRGESGEISFGPTGVIEDQRANTHLIKVQGTSLSVIEGGT